TKSLRSVGFLWQETGRRILPRERRPVERLLKAVDGHFAEEGRTHVGRVERGQLEEPARERIIPAAGFVHRPQRELQGVACGARRGCERFDAPPRGIDTRYRATRVGER